MPDPRDFLPQPPWEGPPIPRGIKRRIMPRYYYHVTTRELVNKVLKEGLVPQERTGDSAYWGRVTKRIYLLEEIDEGGFYGDVILRVKIPPGIRVEQSMYAEGFYVTRPIPPEYIEVYKVLGEGKG